ncbi:MAG: hypothetical protein GXO81_03655 [Chlorobi bacterium]|nr:hypothetical protein [Chlorobiota bacterium]
MKLKKLHIVSITLSFLLALGACSNLNEVKNPLDGFKLIVNYDIFETFVSFRFIDTGTGGLLGVSDGSSVNVTIGGEDQEGVVSQLGEHSTQYASFSGLLALALNPKPPYVPESDNPFNFTITADFDGYYSEEFSVEITETGNHTFEVYMEKVGSPTGYREYFRKIPLNEANEVAHSVSIDSHDKNFCFTIPAGATFFDADGGQVAGDEVSLSVIVYNRIEYAPVPTALITDVEVGGNKETGAFNPLNLAKVRIWSDTKEVSYLQNGEMQICFEIDPALKDPRTWEPIKEGDALKVWQFDEPGKTWVYKNDVLVLKNSNGLKYINTNIDHCATFSGAIVQGVCRFNGDVKFSSEANAFPGPVSLSVDCYRLGDGKFIEKELYEFSESEYSAAFSFLVPENNPVKFSVSNQNNTNSFEATPAEIQVASPCGRGYSFEVQLKPTSMDFAGAIQFHFAGSFPNGQIEVGIDFYDAQTGQLLLTQRHTVSDNEVVDLSTSIKQVNSLRIVYNAINTDNWFFANPSEIIVDNPLANGLLWEVELTPEKCLLNGNLVFDFTGPFGGSNIYFEVEVRDEQTGAVIESYILQCSETNTTIPFSIVLPNDKTVYLKLKRVAGETKFHVYPYEISVGMPCQQNLTWNMEISPVVMQLVNVNVLITCPNAQIIPSFKGYYRLVWEDEWKEVDLVYGSASLNMELNGTYELGIIIDGKMISKEYIVTGPDLSLEFELDDQECGTLGY